MSSSSIILEILLIQIIGFSRAYEGIDLQDAIAINTAITGSACNRDFFEARFTQ